MNKKEKSDQALLTLKTSSERILKQFLIDSEEWRKRHCECAEEKHLISECPKTKLKGFKLLIHNLQKLWTKELS